MTVHLPPNEQELQISSCSDHKYTLIKTSKRAPGLQPVGPVYCPRPNTTNRFIVKMSAGIGPGKDVISPLNVVRLYDRSLTIDGNRN